MASSKKASKIRKSASNSIQSSKEATPMFENLPELKFTPAFVTIGTFGEGEPIIRIDQFRGRNARDLIVGLLNGMMDASVGIYPVLVPGLHLKYTVDALFAAGYVANAGYVSGAYAGEFASLFAEPLRAGWWSIGFEGGQFVFEWQAKHVDYAVGEAEWVKKSRKAFHKHVGLDLLLQGKPIILHYSTNDEWVANKIATKAAQAAMSVADRLVDIRTKVAETRAFNIVRQVEAIYAQPGYVPVAHLAVVRLHDGGTMEPEALVGQTVLKWMGDIRVGAVKVTVENLPVQLDALRRGNMTVSVQ